MSFAEVGALVLWATRITSGKVRACPVSLSLALQVVPGLWLTLHCT